MRKPLKNRGYVPNRIVTDKFRPKVRHNENCAFPGGRIAVAEISIEPGICIYRFANKIEECRASRLDVRT